MREAGFSGFVTVRTLREAQLTGVPKQGGVYVVLRKNSRAPVFLATSPAGPFKGRDPTIPVEALRAAWVPEACVLYVGKAGGYGMQATLRGRLRSYLRHGAGAPAPHWGGRAIWQLADADELLIAWRTVTKGEPRDRERSLIAEFIAAFGKRPFANRAR